MRPHPALLVVIIAFSAFAFGAVESWSSTLVEVILLLLGGIVLWRGGRKVSGMVLPVFVIAALTLLALGQLVPLPAVLWRGLDDDRASLYADSLKADALLRSPSYGTHPVTGIVLPEAQIPSYLPAPKWIAATFTPWGTARAVLALVAAMAFTLAVARLSTGARGGNRGLFIGVGLTGVAVGAAALAGVGGGSAALLGFRESIHAPGAFGPFVNENHGMAFVNLTFPLLYYFLWRQWGRARTAGNRLGILLVSGLLLLLHLGLWATHNSVAGAWTLMMMALLGVCSRLRRNRRALAVLGIGLAVVATGLTVLFVSNGMAGVHGRGRVWANSAAQPHWLAGNGFGSFADRFTAVLSDMPTAKTQLGSWVYPENEFVQLYFEGGVPAFALGGLALLYAIVLGWRAAMAGGGLFLLAAPVWGEASHAMTDFQFHIWPVALAFLLVVALVESRLASLGEAVVPVPATRAKGGRGRWGRALALGMFTLAPLAVAAHLPAATGPLTPLKRDTYAILDKAEGAAAAREWARARALMNTAFTRAVYEGNDAIAERIRMRVGAMGRDTASTDPENAWAALEWFALNSQDFNLEAFGVEGLFLERARAPRDRFDYHLTDHRGDTFRGRAPSVEWTKVWPILRWEGALTRKVERADLFSRARPDWPIMTYCFDLPIELEAGSIGYPGTITVRGPSGGALLYAHPWPYVQASPESPGHWVIPRVLGGSGQFFKGILIFSDAAPSGEKVSVVLTHKLKALGEPGDKP